ncbi:hypothetical protein NMG60_11025773 [Bertholletia excelsa]
MALSGRSLSALSDSSSSRQPLSQSISLVCSITKLLQTLNPQNPNFQISDPSAFNHLAPQLSPALVIDVIKNQSNPYHALFFFDWASNPVPNPNRYSHTHLCYVAITDLLLSHGLFSTAASLLESSNKLSDFMLGKFIKAHANRGDIRGAIQWFYRAKMRESGRCLSSYNAILGVLVRANRVNLARAFFHQIVGEGLIEPDVYTFTTMIRGFCKLGMIEDARKVFDEMKCPPNLVTYNTMISGLCKKGLVESARSIVNKMRGTKDPMPDVVTYTTLIDGFCRRGQLEEANECFAEMLNQNCEPNVLTYNAMIHGFCLSGNIDESKRMMTRMRLRGLKDDVVTHTSLLKGFCIIGKSDEAVNHLKEMVSLGMKPDVTSYGIVVNEFCKQGKANQAIVLLNEMGMRGIKPGVSSFNAVLRLLADSGELDRAIFLLKQMKPKGCPPNFLSYSTVVCSLCKAKGRIAEAEKIVCNMIRDGHSMDANLFSCLVNGYLNDGNYEMVGQIFGEMISKGYKVNLESFSNVVQELRKQGKVSEAEKLFEMSRSCPVNIDIQKGSR